jgi:hypothetical protein
MTMVTEDAKHRITARVWSQSMVSQFVPPGSKAFMDHQDLLADGYLVIEENTAVAPLRRIAPRWRVVSRLVTNMAGSEFGERETVIGSPGYPAYRAVPDKPVWFEHALARIPTGPLTEQMTAYRLASIQPPT